LTSGNGNGRPGKRRSLHPYRDSALAYGVLGGVVVAVALLTGSSVVRALVGGGAAFVLATAWTWWRMRSRAREWERQHR